MAIKIRKKIEETKDKVVLEGEVVDAASDIDVQVPEMNDKFLQTSNSVFGWMLEHRRALIFAVSVVVLSTVGFLFYLQHRESQVVERSVFLSDALVTYTAMTTDEARAWENIYAEHVKARGIEAESGELLHVSYSVPSDEKRYLAITKFLETSLGDVAGSPVEGIARLMLAGTLMRLDKADEASAAYQKVLESAEGDTRLFALLGEVEMYIGAKKYAEAIGVYDEISAMSAGYGSFVELSKGRLYEIMNERDNAIASYVAVVRDYGQVSDQQAARGRLKVLTPDWRDLIVPTVEQIMIEGAAQ